MSAQEFLSQSSPPLCWVIGIVPISVHFGTLTLANLEIRQL